MARARQSAEQLERRARDEFERAQEQHVSVRLAVEAFESDRARAGGLLAEEQPSDLARRIGMTAALAGSIADAVSASGSARWWLLILGAFLTVWAGRGVYRGVRLVSELAWDARGRPVSSLKASLVVTGFGLSVIALQLLLPKVTESIGLPAILRFVLGIVLASAFSLWLLWLLPRGGAPWTALVPGAVLFGVGMRVLGLAAATYFAYRLDHSGDLYGALGIAIVMMLYLFLVARVFVAAQFLNATLYRRRHRSAGAEPASDGDRPAGEPAPGDAGA